MSLLDTQKACYYVPHVRALCTTWCNHCNVTQVHVCSGNVFVPFQKCTQAYSYIFCLDFYEAENLSMDLQTSPTVFSTVLQYDKSLGVAVKSKTSFHAIRSTKPDCHMSLCIVAEQCVDNAQASQSRHGQYTAGGLVYTSSLFTETQDCSNSIPERSRGLILNDFISRCYLGLISHFAQWSD